ncbi:hypothetical protein NQ315_015167 [Exocentrus adspersus]|uniref:Reverse transcriptase n=1 Tax=Exocentrus adspersus TaxID=1586481 RepID=A0AAV8VBG6_9CUCU|nr:hypothetical protein NQ315_015167 [Exocentrus adspersus]
MLLTNCNNFRTYRTVSVAATQVISGIPPIHLLIEERRNMFEGTAGYENSREARIRTISKLQEEWSTQVETAQWTKRLIPDLRVWLDCPHRDKSNFRCNPQPTNMVNYYFTQALTGRSFKKFTCRIGKTEDDLCERYEEVDNALHALFECSRWRERRRAAEAEMGNIFSTNSLIRTMCENRTKWDIGFAYISNVMKVKEEEERRDQTPGEE